MKKPALCLVLCLSLAIALVAQAPQQAPQPKPEDALKSLVLVEKTRPVPDKMKTGFEAITGKDSVTLLSYISSDLLEGREAATRGFELAAEYIGSLFSLWKLKPAGDTPAMPTGRRAFAAFGPGGPPMTPQERTYFQGMALEETSDISTAISLECRVGPAVKSHVFDAGVDFAGTGIPNESVEAPVVFAGYGITEKEVGYDDFKNLDVKGKIVLVLTEAPGKNDPKSPFQLNKGLKEKYFPAGPQFPFRRGGFNKLQEIYKLGPAAVLQVVSSGKDGDLFKQMATPMRPFSDERPSNEPRRRLSIPGGGARMPFERSMGITITHEMANAILESSGQKIEDLQKKIESATKPASMEVPGARISLKTTSTSKLVKCRNVIGFVEGSDPVLKDEVVVVGAHLDHLGRRGEYIFNGADDNGSGSVGVMNIARAFAANPQKPKRSVVFCLWTGEEEGLLGSRYYVQNPAFPLEKTVAYLNLDMISRPYDERTISRSARMFNLPNMQDLIKKITPVDFLPVSFSADAGLGEILKEADQCVGLDLFLRESGNRMERDMGGSDHSSFASAKIPWVFCIAAATEDYHQTSDSVEKVSGELMEKISKLNYLAAYALADK